MIFANLISKKNFSNKRIEMLHLIETHFTKLLETKGKGETLNFSQINALREG